MNSTSDAFAPAIAALQRDLMELESKTREIKSALNTLHKHAGLPEPYTLEDDNDGFTLSSIQADTFYGKTISAAAREYLEMRKASGLGPAAPRDIYEGLIAGGFAFDAKTEENALVSLRATIRKSSKIFHRLPNSQYGLLAWYPNAKQSKIEDDDNDEKKSADEDSPSADIPFPSDASLNDQEEDASETHEERS